MLIYFVDTISTKYQTDEKDVRQMIAIKLKNAPGAKGGPGRNN